MLARNRVPGFRFNDFQEIINTINQSKNKFTPNVNIIKNNDSYIIDIELPGVNKEEVSIKLKDNSLIISGEKKIREKESGNEYIKVETIYGKFERIFNIEEKVFNQDRITSIFNNGVLEITLPLLEVKEKVEKLIEIN